MINMLMPAPILLYSLFYSTSISHAHLLAHTMSMTSRGKPPGVSGGYSGVLSRSTPQRGSNNLSLALCAKSTCAVMSWASISDADVGDH